jgi:hypothetical protein
MGRDCGTIPISRLPSSIERCAFLCVNNYTSPSLSLGAGPLNDGVSMAKLAEIRKLPIYFLHNPRKATFLKYFEHFIKVTNDHLVFYYVGHGTRVRDTNRDEADGYDEAFVFEDGTIIDDVLIQTLAKYKNPENQVTLVTDACHSGSIWDIQNGSIRGKPLPPMIMSISAATDAQTSKQTIIERLEQGVFTYNMYKIVKDEPEITPSNLKARLVSVLKQYAQTCTISTTTPEIMDAVLFDSFEF